MTKLGITYENWLKGRLELDSAISYYKTSGYKPKFVEICLFSLADQIRIFKNQKTYFHLQINEYWEMWMVDFDLKYSNSREKKAFVARLYQKVLKALNGEVKELKEVGFVALEDYEIVDFNLYLSAKHHFDKCIVNGGKFTYESISNPVSREMSNNAILPEVFAECLWQMKRHIENNFSSSNKIAKSSIKSKGDDEKAENIVESYDKRIFNDFEAFLFFIELLDVLPLANHRNACLSLLYYNLQTKKYGNVIKKDIQKQYYCDFCNEFGPIKIEGSSLTEPQHIRQCRNKNVNIMFENYMFKRRN